MYYDGGTNTEWLQTNVPIKTEQLYPNNDKHLHACAWRIDDESSIVKNYSSNILNEIILI